MLGRLIHTDQSCMLNNFKSPRRVAITGMGCVTPIGSGRHGVLPALTLDNDALAERLGPGKETARKGLVDDDDGRRVLIVAFVKFASPRKGYFERAEIIRANRTMVRHGLIFGPWSGATRDQEGVRVAIAAQG